MMSCVLLVRTRCQEGAAQRDRYHCRDVREDDLEGAAGGCCYPLYHPRPPAQAGETIGELRQVTYSLHYRPLSRNTYKDVANQL